MPKKQPVTGEVVAVEESVVPLTVTFCGETFAMVDKLGHMPFMRLSDVAMRGVDAGSIEGLAVMYQFLKACIADWDRFCDVATENACDDDNFWEVVAQIYEANAGRPTGRPSASSDGPPSTPRRSAGASSSPAKDLLEAKGRPDLAVVVMMADEERTA